ncbi:MAG: hypothetical protein HY960_06135 [Ignavibacteriae bacterium]|nr:hypothetical protein [Ignavibacteriota bacterium]
MKYLTLFLFSSIFFSSLTISQERQNITTYKLDDGIIYKTTNKTTWQSVPTSEPVQLLAWHPERANIVLAVIHDIVC